MSANATTNTVAATITHQRISFGNIPMNWIQFRQEWKPQAVTPKKPVSPPSFMDSAVMQHSLSHYDINPLYTFLSDTIGRSNTERLFKLYRVGTSKKWNGSAVFWQVDSNGQVHTGKIMGYDAKTGHRLKVPHPHVCWVHTELRLSRLQPMPVFLWRTSSCPLSRQDSVHCGKREDSTHCSSFYA